MRRRHLFVLALMVGGGAGCSPYTAVRDPLPPTVQLPDAFTAGGDAPEGELAPDRWWTAFEDPALSEAVETAVTESFQVRAAWARVRQADMLGMQASSQWWPQVSAEISASYRRSVLVLPNFTSPDGGTQARAIENPNYSISLPVSYELDLWDRIGSQARAAGMDMAAARDDVDAAAMTVAANVVEAWLNVVYQRQLRALIEAQVETSEDYVELVELRFAEGLGTALDVYQQRAQVEGLRAQLAQTVAQERVAEQQLAVLMGRIPGISVVPEDRVEIPPPPSGAIRAVPSDLLIRRPDVRAARHRIEAADQRVAAAIADRFPRFNLSASIGFASPDLATLFESFVFNLLAGIVAPLFDGERREAVVQQNHAIVWERTEQLAQTILTAAQEVEAAMVQEQQQRVQIEALEARVEASDAALEQARERYASGLLDGYLQVLTSLSVVQQSEQALLQAKRQLLSYRVQLHRALGGAWSTELDMPEPHRPVREEADDAEEDEEREEREG